MMKKIILGVILIVVYVIFALFAAGAGHGTYIFLAVVMPCGFGAVIYPFLFGLSNYLGSNFVRVIFILMIFFHYWTTIVFVYLWWEDDFPYFLKTWNLNPMYIILPIIWFLVIQFLVWRSFVKGVQTPIPELK